MATEWVRGGHHVCFVAHGSGRTPSFPTEAEVLWVDEHGRRVESNNEPHIEGNLRMPKRARSLRDGLRRYARDADVLLVTSGWAAWAAHASGLDAARVYYVQSYEPGYQTELLRDTSLSVRTRTGVLLTYLTARTSYLLPFHQVVNSSVYFDYPGIKASAWVPPGLDLDDFYPKHDPQPHGPFRLGCISRTQPIKGTRYVIEAFERLREAGRDVELWAAYGHLPDGYAERDGVRVVRPRDDAELSDFYRAVDVMAAPGTGQLGAPHYPVMEAMACGTPVVTTGYIPAGPANAWIVPTHDGRAVADAVAQVMDHPGQAKARVARALEAVRPFGWPEVASQLMTQMEQAHDQGALAVADDDR